MYQYFQIQKKSDQLALQFGRQLAAIGIFGGKVGINLWFFGFFSFFVYVTFLRVCAKYALEN